MSEDNQNVTKNMVAIVDADGTTVNVDPELLRQYVDEAFDHLRDQKKANTLYKEVVEAAAETTGVAKPLLNKWIKARFKDETKKLKAVAETFESLEAAIAVKQGQ